MFDSFYLCSKCIKVLIIKNLRGRTSTINIIIKLVNSTRNYSNYRKKEQKWSLTVEIKYSESTKKKKREKLKTHLCLEDFIIINTYFSWSSCVQLNVSNGTELFVQLRLRFISHIFDFQILSIPTNNDKFNIVIRIVKTIALQLFESVIQNFGWRHILVFLVSG